MGFQYLSAVAVFGVTVYTFVYWTLQASGVVDWMFNSFPRIIVNSIVLSLLTILFMAVIFVGFFGVRFIRHGAKFPHYKYIR